MPARRRKLLPRTAFLATAIVATALGPAACASVEPSRSPSSAGTPTATATPAVQTPGNSAAPASPSGVPDASPAARPFPFSPDAILGFYEGEGLACQQPVPSKTAAGWNVTTCQGTDVTGRPVAVGLITDQDGGLGAGFATVTALPGEDLLEPENAIDGLSGFLAAMLGEEAATQQLPWLAGHLGDEYAETTVGDLTVATYIESPDDSTRIYLEIDGREYLAAPST
jgi:hypothetical protein